MQNNPDEDVLLAPKHAGVMLDITTAGVTRLVERGLLPVTRDSLGRKLFRRADVLALKTRRDEKRRKKASSRPWCAGSGAGSREHSSDS